METPEHSQNGNKAKQSKRKGPMPGPPTEPVTVRLEPHQAEWGKRQRGGLSALLRAMLDNAMASDRTDRADQKEATQ